MTAKEKVLQAYPQSKLLHFYATWFVVDAEGKTLGCASSKRQAWKNVATKIVPKISQKE